jgi:hypothetical protein
MSVDSLDDVTDLAAGLPDVDQAGVIQFLAFH